MLGVFGVGSVRILMIRAPLRYVTRVTSLAFTQDQHSPSKSLSLGSSLYQIRRALEDGNLAGDKALAFPGNIGLEEEDALVSL